jgi:hypothetical protein
MVGETLVYLSFFLPGEELVVGEKSESGAVISAIFEPPQSLQEDRSRLLFADVTNNATHKI